MRNGKRRAQAGGRVSPTTSMASAGMAGSASRHCRVSVREGCWGWGGGMGALAVGIVHLERINVFEFKN